MTMTAIFARVADRIALSILWLDLKHVMAVVFLFIYLVSLQLRILAEFRTAQKSNTCSLCFVGDQEIHNVKVLSRRAKRTPRNIAVTHSRVSWPASSSRY